MTRYLFEVELRPDNERGYCINVPDLEGCFSQGDTLDEALERAADALKTHVAALLKYGDTVPSPIFEHKAPKGGKVIAISFETDASYIIDAVSPSEAAAMLGISRSRVSQMIRDGVLDAHKGAGEVWVDLASINTRIASPRGAGRPRKELVTSAK